MPGKQNLSNRPAYFSDKAPESSATTAGRVGDIPELITKKWLYMHFKICRSNVRGLYRWVLTVEVCTEIGIPQEVIRERGFRTFSAKHSRQLVKILFE